MGSKMDKFQGKMKKGTGKVLGNKKMQAEGAYQEGKAELKDRIADKFD